MTIFGNYSHRSQAETTKYKLSNLCPLLNKSHIPLKLYIINFLFFFFSKPVMQTYALVAYIY